VVLLRPPHGLLQHRVREAPVDADHNGLVLLVAHHDALQRTLRHIAFPYLFAFERAARFGLAPASAFVLALLLVSPLGLAATGFGAGIGRPERFCAAMVLMRAMSRRTTRTRAVFSSWFVARWNRRLNCSFFSFRTSSSS